MGQQYFLVVCFRLALGQPRDRAAQLDGLLREPRQQCLLGAHALGQRRQTLNQRGIGGRGLFTAFLTAAKRAGEIVQPIGGALQQCLDIGRDALFALGLQRATGESCRAGQPFLQLGVEAALCLAGLKFEEAEDERSGQAEQRRAEGGRHALERAFDSLLQLGEDLDGVASGHLHADDGVGDGADRLQQPQKVPSRPRKISRPIM